MRTSSDDPVHVHLDHRSMGVGGDNSWYPNVVHEEYTVPPDKAYRFRVLLKALAPGGAAAAPTAGSSSSSFGGAPGLSPVGEREGT